MSVRQTPNITKTTSFPNVRREGEKETETSGTFTNVTKIQTPTRRRGNPENQQTHCMAVKQNNEKIYTDLLFSACRKLQLHFMPYDQDRCFYEGTQDGEFWREHEVASSDFCADKQALASCKGPGGGQDPKICTVCLPV